MRRQVVTGLAALLLIAALPAGAALAAEPMLGIHIHSDKAMFQS